MIMQDLLSATEVRADFSRFIDNVVHVKPLAVKRNRDVFWSISQQITLELLSGYTIAVEYEQEEDGSFSGSLLPFNDIVCYGDTFEQMMEDAALQLIEYAQDYYKDFPKYYNSPNRKGHLPYILHVLAQENLEGVKALIRG